MGIVRSTLNQHVFSRYSQHSLRVGQGTKERLKEWNNSRVSGLSNGRWEFSFTKMENIVLSVVLREEVSTVCVA